MHNTIVSSVSPSVAVTAAAVITNVPPINSSIEGLHYKLLYGGSKFFWMNDKEIDLSIYQFFEPSTIEVIPYDLDLNEELPRLYLNMAIILPMLNYASTTLSLDHGTSNAAERRDQELTRFVISRLHLTTVPLESSDNIINNNHNNASSSSSSRKQVIYLSNSIDPIDIAPLLSSPPSSLIPVKVTRRRNTIGELVEETKLNRRNTVGNLVEEIQIEIIKAKSNSRMNFYE